jgi:hypothetical protein
LLIWLETGKFPEDMELIWFETENDENGYIRPTGKIERFPYKIDPHKEQRIKNWQDDIFGIFLDIQQAQKEWEDQKFNENK